MIRGGEGFIGKLYAQDMPLKRDAEGCIEAVQLDSRERRFRLDALGWVAEMD